MSNKGFIYKDGKAFDVEKSFTPQYGPRVYDTSEEAMRQGGLEDYLKNMQRPPKATYDPIWKERVNNEKEAEDSSWCFISSACFKCLGFDDKRVELHKLRSFRDSYLLEAGKGMDDVREYSSLAPQIVNNIDKAKNATEIYSFIYSKMIVPAIDLIDLKDYDRTHILFKEGFRVIRQNYLL